MAVLQEHLIIIRTQADAGGARQAADALQQLGGTTKKTGEATEEATGKTEKLGEAHGELKKAIREVTEANPALGLALQTVFNPANAGIAGVIFLFGSLKKEIEEMNQRFDEMGEAAAKPIGNIKEALRQMRDEFLGMREDFALWQDRLKENTDALTEALGNITKRIEEQKTAQIELLKAQEATELARVNGDVDKEAEIRTRYRTLERSQDTGAMKAEFDATEQALLGLNKAKRVASEEVDNAEGARRNPERLLAIQKLPEEISGMQEYLLALDKQKKQAATELEKAQKAQTRQEFFLNLPFFSHDKDADSMRAAMAKRIAEAQDKVTATGGEYSRTEDKIRNSETRLDDYKAAQKAADEAAAHARSLFQSIEEQLKAVSDKYNDLEAKIRLDKSFGTKTQNLEQLQDVLKTPTGQMISQASEIAARLVSGRRISGAERASLGQAENFLSNNHGASVEMTRYLAQINGNTDALLALIQRNLTISRYQRQLMDRYMYDAQKEIEALKAAANQGRKF